MAEEQGPQLYNTEDQGPHHSLLGSALKVGGIIAAGAAGWRFRGGIGTGLKYAGRGLKFGGEFVGTLASAGITKAAGSEALHSTLSDIKMFGKALDNAMDGRSIFSHLGNPNRFEDRFEQSVNMSLESRARGAGMPFGKEDLEFETKLQDVRTKWRQITSATFENHRTMYVEQELGQKLHQLSADEIKDNIMNEAVSYRQGWLHGNNLSKPSVGNFVDHVLEKNKEFAAKLEAHKISRDEFVDTMFKTLDRYKSVGSEGFLEKHHGDVSKAQHYRQVVKQNKRNVWNDFITANKAKRDAFNEKVMANNGYKHTTVKDVREHKNGNLFDFNLRKRYRDLEGGRRVNARFSSKVSKLAKFDPRLNDVVVDSHVWHNNRDEFLDNRWMARGAIGFLDTFRRTTQVPFLRFNPLDLMHFTTWEAIREAPTIAIRRMGTIDPALHGSVLEYGHPNMHNKDAAVGVLGRNYINTSNGNVYDLTTATLVKQDVYQMSARFGMGPRALAGMANLHTQEYTYKKGVLGFFQKLFDVGKQETEPSIKGAIGSFTKFDNPEWGPNLHNSLFAWMQDEKDGVALDKRRGLAPIDTFKLMFSQMESKSSPLSDDVVNYIAPHITKAYGSLGIDITKLDDPDYAMEALGTLKRGLMDRQSDIARVSTKVDNTMEGIDRFISETHSKYVSDPQAFMRNKRIKPGNSMELPEWMSALDISDTQLIDKTDDVKRLVHMHALRQLEYATGTDGEKLTVAKLVQQGINEGALDKGALKEVRNLDSLSTMRQWHSDIYGKDENARQYALDTFADKITDETSALSVATQQAMKEFNPWYAKGPGKEPPQHYGFTNNISMNKLKGKTWAIENFNKRTAQGQSQISAMFDTGAELFGQFFAGRKNLGKVTTGSLFPYYYAERLDNAVSYSGLGLSQKHRGSFQQIMTNQFMRRIVLPYVAIQQLGWANSLLGNQPTDTAADAYVNMRTDVQWIKEFTGLNDIGRQWSRVFTGADQLTQTPFARAFNFATLGIFSDNRSGEDEKHYWESGEDPIRKGRYWSLGSGTPYTGGKIDRFEPNWYRKMKSDYKFTDTMYGSRSEYYANAWFPTLTHPLAPLRHFVLDPYHWENKHKDDRPYPETGGFSELETIPIIGTSVDNTVSSILKPHRRDPRLRKAHREYLKEINDNIAAQYDQMAMGGYLQGMPAGGTGLLQENEVTNAGQLSDSGGYSVGTGNGSGGSGGGGYGIGDGSYSPYDTGSSKDAKHGTGGLGRGRGSRGATGAARQQIALVNAAMSDIGGPALGITGKNIHSVTSLEDLRDPDIIANLHDIGDYYSMGGQARDMMHSATEIGGIYGFMASSITGFDKSGRGMVLDTSNRMTSYNRAWWDNEFGGADGVGGGISEIFRRYITRDPNKNYWNPIRNRMPYWMPGADYFIDFQHGDPYVKVPHGEMRLPGAAYEKLYKLHPDAFGDYGAFDRYRILADVAPYSQQFKFYKQIVSKMNGAGMLSDSEKKEYGEIRDQVSQRKEKYRFYDRQFTKGYADVNHETVHVTRMIDSTTFLTKEHPYNPIRMAAVKVKSDDTEAQEWLKQYVHAGATLKIETDKDPLNQVRDDTYQTIRAVVYDKWAGNINFKLANRKEGGVMGLGGQYTASTHDDGTATSKRALYSGDMITVGKLWEWTTHTFLPNVPIVGTIADKFLQVRDPIEMYKKQEIYGKAWRPWTDPWGSWIKPMVDQMASNNPVVAAAQGAGIGWLFTKATGKVWGTHIGAIVGGAAATARVFAETFHKMTSNSDDATWIPKRRQQERDINEYFDMLHYMKYHGLYEKARHEAIIHEHVDVEDLVQNNDKRGQKNKGKRKYLESNKKWLSMAKKLGYGDSGTEDEELGNVREELKAIDADRPLTKLGPMAMLALRYKDEYESTLYGADENGDMTKIFRALPNKDREFFQKFMTASPSEREEILRMVPKNERRFYQAKWGLKVDKKPSLNEYFRHHYLPGAGWAGWKPDVSLENYKVKVIKNDGLELTEFGDWGDDDKRAEQSKADVLPMHSLSSRIDVSRIEKVLRGAGLDNVKVTMSTTHGQMENKIDMAMDILKDRSMDIVNELNNNMSGLISAGSQAANGIIKRPSTNNN